MPFRRTSLKRLQLNAFGYATWKSYTVLRKKAVGQEFTWSGFVISLSIAFLFVVSCSTGLNSLYERSLNREISTNPTGSIVIQNIPNVAPAIDSIC
jgi:hypothetical protein